MLEADPHTIRQAIAKYYADAPPRPVPKRMAGLPDVAPGWIPGAAVPKVGEAAVPRVG